MYSHSIAEMHLMRPDVHQYFLCQRNTAVALTDGYKNRKLARWIETPEGTPSYSENVPSASPHCLFTVCVIAISIPHLTPG